MNKILNAKPSITQLEIDYVTDAVANGWGENCYDYIYKFKTSVKKYFNSKYAWPSSSCHGALHMALMALDVKAGDEVIVPDSTWVGSVFPISWLGATPVFVDVMEKSWCIDPAKIEEAITAKTKAIICVHLYGNLCEMDEIMAISKKYNIPVIEDAAEAIGSEYKGKKAGSIADFGVFSFHGTKTLTTGEGGVLISNRDDFVDRINTLDSQGRKKDAKLFWVDEIGLKYKMSNMQAALGLAQFERVEELVSKKREIFSWYKGALSSIEDISLNFEQSYAHNSYWMPTVVFGQSWNFDIHHCIESLNEQGIAARPFFYPVSSLPMYDQGAQKNSQKISNMALNLPSPYDLSKKEIEYIIASLIQVIKGEINNDY